jgi:DNA-binding response OmpR family regulator
MNVTKGKDWLDAELDAPMVAVLGGSQTDVEILESMVSEQGLRLFSTHQLSGAEAVSPEIVILDISEADTRVQVDRRLSEIRLRWDAPIVCLVSHQGRLDLEAMATLGADDYLFKPLRMLELWNRVRVLLRRRELTRSVPLVERRNRSRRKGDRAGAPVAKAEDRCVIDEANKSVVLEGRKLNLSPKEYELFCLLLQNAGRVLSPREIVEHVWQDTQRASAADVHQYMHLLRRKVEPELSRPRWIVTIRGFGYKLVIPNPT